MELSEAKERLKDLIDTSEKGAINYPDDKELFMADKEALETVLKALDNSISKDKVRKKIEQLEFLRDDAIEDNFLGDARNLKERIDVLQELLGEE